MVALPEGMFYPNKIGPIQSGIIKHTWQVEETGLKIPVIPIGIEYESLYRPRARAFFRIGQAIYNASYPDQGQMVTAITQHLGQLSGLV